MTTNVQFSDDNETAIVSVFGGPQDPAVYQHLGEVADDDPRLLALIDPTSTLAGAQSAALTAIDAAAGQVRLKYITSVPGQELTYHLKAQDAANYKLAGYPAAISDYPFVQGYAIALYGATPTAAQYQSACDDIIATQTAWVAIGSQIERARSAGKVAVQGCATVADVNTARDSAIAALMAM